MRAFFTWIWGSTVEIPADPLNGWAAVLLQAGAFGLLAYVVVFLYPRQQKESREEREARDKIFRDLVEALQMRFLDRNQAVVAAVEKQTVSIVTELKDTHKDMVAALARRQT